MQEMDILFKGALLHDVGKICRRANPASGAHSLAGAEFLKVFLDNTEDARQLLRCVKYHHAAALKTASLKADDLSYIVYEADNIAAGMDRRENDTEHKGFDAMAPLESIFNIFGGSDMKRLHNKYHVHQLDPQKAFNYPVAESCLATADKYEELLAVLQSNFQRGRIADMSPNELLRILEDVSSYVPSSTNVEEVCDISLFIHSKITAAVAVCLKQYFDSCGNRDYKRQCYFNNKELRQRKTFLMVSGDISGIQDFIYTIPSQGALKSLRGRSVYLELFLENFIDELLTDLGLSRANLLYSGGGHFYLLAAATEKTKKIVAEAYSNCNKWLLEQFGIKLYLAMGTAECTAQELMHSDSQRSIFAQVSERLSKAKLSRYNAETLARLFNVDSQYNSVHAQGRECGVCHMSSVELEPYEDTDIQACPMCKSLYKFGNGVLGQNCSFVISDEQRTDEQGTKALALYGTRQALWLYVRDNSTLEAFPGNIVRIYSKNAAVTGNSIATRLWMADYCARDKQNKVLNFAELAKSCCGGKQGIKRLGVLRADVDNLGAAFISGFIDSKIQDNCRYATFSRYADLSRDMIMFFKLAVDKICRGESVDAPFNIFGVNKEPKRKLSIVYSGGDDMFLVGAWDELLEAAVDIRRALARFTGGKLSFSAGMALFNENYPVAMMAAVTGKLEDAAKSVKDKDSIALFGFDTETVDAGQELKCRHVYKWENFIDKVCLEKLKFLQQHINLNEKQENKLPVGKTALYRLLELLEEISADGRINLARFAYTLARMQPGEKSGLKNLFEDFQKQMYLWAKDSRDSKELITAITLLIYYLRDDKEA